uniref:Pyruvate kinase n=1 Tax=Corethron hystrix TaxID=216773 RepID=A0A7S1BUF8_9STRA|mmetsp:Transcript_40320/g.94739  ORF Transcript_40320/g.94739 Transcript_40320/m.94739 type:complete len:575 (+) Transcript_40320:34-1758(+)
MNAAAASLLIRRGIPRARAPIVVASRLPVPSLFRGLASLDKDGLRAILPVRKAFDLPDPGRGSYPRPPLSKIVSTIGPTSENFDTLQEVVSEGMRIMRLNFSHATFEEANLRIDNLKRCRGETTRLGRNGNNDNNLRAILLDTRGPEIRSGKLADDLDGKKSIELRGGDRITLHTSDIVRDAGSTASDLYIDYPGLASVVQPGSRVLLDDGAVVLNVLESYVATEAVTCEVEDTGDIRSRAGVNLPGCPTDLPPLSKKDEIDIRYGLERDIDYVAASFVQDAKGVNATRAFCASVLYEEMGLDKNTHPLPLIIAKIESVQALHNFDEILAAADGIMVARGDLGVEIPIQQVTNAQKEMIARCNEVGKPVVVATQMLESMINSPRPTRAEVADITNAIYDGADAVMLSGETAKGKYPVAAVRMMNDIVRGAERFEKEAPDLAVGGRRRKPFKMVEVKKNINDVSMSAVAAAEKIDAKAIIVLTNSGTIPRFLAAHRPHCPILAFCPTYKIGRQLQIHRGVHPIVEIDGLEAHKRPSAAMRDAKDLGFISSGDDVVMVCVDKGTTDFFTMKITTVS